MGTHILHGDYRRVLGDVQADLVVTSPPYNIGSTSPAITGRRKFGGYDPKSYRSITDYQDQMREDKYQDSQIEFLYWCAEHLREGGTVCYNHKPRRRCGRMIHPLSWIQQCQDLELMEEVIWDRGSTHNHGRKLFWPTTERVYVLKKTGDDYALDNYRDRGLLFRSDIWKIKPAKANGHNAPFPETLVAQCILAFTNHGDMVCDPYLGSGTTAVVAQRLGRNFVGSERLKKYWRQSKKRLEGYHVA